MFQENTFIEYQTGTCYLKIKNIMYWFSTSKIICHVCVVKSAIFVTTFWFLMLFFLYEYLATFS